MGKKPKSKAKSSKGRGGGGGGGRTAPARNGQRHDERTTRTVGDVSWSLSSEKSLSWRGIVTGVWTWLRDVVTTVWWWDLFRGGRRLRQRRQEEVSPSAEDLSSFSNEREWKAMLQHVAVLSLDCEMVGAGPRGWESLLARCSIIRYDLERDGKRQERRRRLALQGRGSGRRHESAPLAGARAEKKMVGYRVVYDTLVRPTKPVTDYRTRYSGITQPMLEGHSSLPLVSYQQCRRDVAAILKTGRLPSSSSSTEPQSEDEQEKKDSDRDKEKHKESSIQDNAVGDDTSEAHKKESGDKTETTSTPADKDEDEEDIRAVLVVGHALKNDFEALDLKHPASLIRDTSLYPPFTRGGGRTHAGRGGGGRRRPRKLRDLAYEELDGAVIQASTQTGHSSVEDSAAALSLYCKYWRCWEASLRFPLRKRYDPSRQLSRQISAAATTATPSEKPQRPCWQPLDLYLDGSNLPLGLRRVDDDDDDQQETDGDGPPSKWQLLSKTNIGTSASSSSSSRQGRQSASSQGRTKKSQYTKGSRRSGSGSTNRSQKDTCHDWVPVLAHALKCQAPQWASISILFDGSKYRQAAQRPTSTNLGTPGLELVVTPDGVEADTLLWQRCRPAAGKTGNDKDVALPTASVSRVRELLSKPIAPQEEEGEEEETENDNGTEPQEEKMFPFEEEEEEDAPFRWFGSSSPRPVPEPNDLLEHWILVRRLGGGKKSSASAVLKRWHLNRPTEGALCLGGLSAALRRQGARTADELYQGAAGGLLECHVCPRSALRTIVVTDDVLLAHRIASPSAMVLSFAQFQQLLS